jgi:glycosyltransferase involved in cell wall biosynthesis
MPGASDEPLVTVIVPTWNRRALLAEALGSLYAQTYPRWEAVVADDGSGDGTAEWVDSLGDPRVRVVRCSHRGHVGNVRNRGVAAGTGELLAFLDSDDVWLPRKLELQVAAMRESSARWCYAGYEMMDEAGRPAPFASGEYVPISGRIAGDLLAFRANVHIGTVLVERVLFEEAGGFSEDPRLTMRGDHELVLRLALHAEALALGEVLARVRAHPGRITAACADPFERSALVYDLFLARSPPPELARAARRVRARLLADAGAQRLSRGEYGRAGRLFARALADGPSPARWLRAVARGVRGRLRGGP